MNIFNGFLAIFNKKWAFLALILLFSAPFLQGMSQSPKALWACDICTYENQAASQTCLCGCVKPSVVPDSKRADVKRKASPVDKEPAKKARVGESASDVGIELYAKLKKEHSTAPENFIIGMCDEAYKNAISFGQAKHDDVTGLGFKQFPGLYQFYPGLKDLHGDHYGTMCGLYALYFANTLEAFGMGDEVDLKNALNNRDNFSDFFTRSQDFAVPGDPSGNYDAEELITIAKGISIQNCWIVANDRSGNNSFYDIKNCEEVNLGDSEFHYVPNTSDDFVNFIGQIKAGIIPFGTVLINNGGHWVTLYIKQGSVFVVDSANTDRINGDDDGAVINFIREFWTIAPIYLPEEIDQAEAQGAQAAQTPSLVRAGNNHYGVWAAFGVAVTAAAAVIYGLPK